MQHRGGFAVHLFRGADHATTMHLGDGLMAQTDAEGGDGGRQRLQHLQADAGLVRITRSGRQHDGIGLQGTDLVKAEGIVAVHLQIRRDRMVGSQFPEVLHQVEGEAVVVVDDQEHRPVLRNSGEAAGAEAAGTARSTGS